MLLALVLGKPREWVISHYEHELNEDQLKIANQFLDRLVNGEPLAYITGKKAFFGMDFLVSPDVLIPRPETELLVEEAIQWLLENPAKRSAIDAGTGSGVIAISLADAIPDLHITAIDVSQAALDIALKNCLRFHHEDQITFLQNYLLDGVVEKTDLITANLPYIPSKTLDGLTDLRFEPRLALDGGEDGTKFIGELLEGAKSLLRPGGLLLLEIETTYSERVLQMAQIAFPDAKSVLLYDYANLPRIVKIQK